MPLLRAITSGLRSLFRREQVDRELDEELRDFLQMAIEEKMKQGMSRKDALRAVRLERGSPDVAKEEVRSAGWESYAETVGRDLHFALRQWTKNPGLALSAVVVLTLGIGVSLTIFGFVDAALLQPLPYASPERLMSVNESNAESPRWPLSYPDYLDWQRLNKSFRSLDIYNGSGYLLQTPSGATAVQGERVSGGFFQTLGVRPMLGRDFSLDEDIMTSAIKRSTGARLHLLAEHKYTVTYTLSIRAITSCPPGATVVPRRRMNTESSLLSRIIPQVVEAKRAAIRESVASGVALSCCLLGHEPGRCADCRFRPHRELSSCHHRRDVIGDAPWSNRWHRSWDWPRPTCTFSGAPLWRKLSALYSVWIAGVLIGISTRDLTIGSEILGRTSPSLVDLLIALVGGLAGGFAFVSTGLNSL